MYEMNDNLLLYNAENFQLKDLYFNLWETPFSSKNANLKNNNFGNIRENRGRTIFRDWNKVLLEKVYFSLISSKKKSTCIPKLNPFISSKYFLCMPAWYMALILVCWVKFWQLWLLVCMYTIRKYFF